MGNFITAAQQTAAINQEGDLVAFSGLDPALTEMGAFVYKNDGGTWAQFGSTGRVKEQSASAIGYTGSFGDTGTTIIVAYCDITENAHFLCVSNPHVGQGGGDGIGFTGAAFVFEFDTGTTGYGTPTQQLTRPRDTKESEFLGYGSNPQFGPTINTGTTDTLFISNEAFGTIGIVSLTSEFKSIYDIWEYNGSSWVRNPTFSYSVANPNHDLVRHHYNATSKTVFTMSLINDTITSRTFADGNIVTSNVIDTGVSSLYNIFCSGDGLFLYVGTNGGDILRIYSRNSIDESFSFLDSYSPPAGGVSFNTLNFYQSNNTGSRLLYLSTVGDNTIIYNTLPDTGAGGASQHAYISNGSDGTSTQGGVGVNNPNAKSDVKIASGGGYGGASSTSAALNNTGSGGAGRYNTSGTAGSSGFINVRRWNSGI